MAIKVEFDAWINDVKSFDWGTVLKVSHDQRAKNEQSGEWETVGKDYLDVTVTAEQLSMIGDAKLVHVVGTLKKGNVFTKKDGSQDIDLKVRATELSPIQRNKPAEPSGWDKPAIADEDMPF